VTAAEQQRTSALRRANEIRIGQAQLKRQIHSGETTVAEVILDRPEEVASMRVSALIRAQKQWGEGRALRLMKAMGVSPPARCRNLTDRQRDLLAELTGGRS
jgi:hypothetical protein